MENSTYENIIGAVNQLSRYISRRIKENKFNGFTDCEKRLILSISDYCKSSSIYKMQLQERQKQREIVICSYSTAEALFRDIIEKIVDCSNDSQRFSKIVLWFPILNDVIVGKIILGG